MTENLDPEDWPGYRRLAHELLDAALDHIEGAHDRPVWRPVPETVKAAIAEPLPRKGAGLESTAQTFRDQVMPYSTGNTHPRFFGWVHGTGTAGGMIGEMLAAAINSNLGGREHAPVYVERQVIAWCREIFGLPDTAGGLLVSGTSMATLLGLAIARQQHAPVDMRQAGLTALSSPMVLYTSAQAHNSIAKAVVTLGLGGRQLRSVPLNDQGGIDVDALQSMIARDRDQGFLPFAVVGTAGTVNSGDFDDLEALADLAAAEKLWLHVDGAFGALAILSPAHRHLVKGIERADSLAFDFHKWLHVPYDAGCLLVRDQADQLAAFSDRPDYLAEQERGLAAGNPWFCELGIELSRGFRAAKVWFTLKEHGTEKLGRMVAKNCGQASYLNECAHAHPELESLAPTRLNIACLRYVPAQDQGPVDLDRLNAEIVMRLQEAGSGGTFDHEGQRRPRHPREHHQSPHQQRRHRFVDQRHRRGGPPRVRGTRIGLCAAIKDCGKSAAAVCCAVAHPQAHRWRGALGAGLGGRYASGHATSDAPARQSAWTDDVGWFSD